MWMQYEFVLFVDLCSLFLWLLLVLAWQVSGCLCNPITNKLFVLIKTAFLHLSFSHSFRVEWIPNSVVLSAFVINGIANEIVLYLMNSLILHKLLRTNNIDILYITQYTCSYVWILYVSLPLHFACSTVMNSHMDFRWIYFWLPENNSSSHKTQIHEILFGKTIQKEAHLKPIVGKRDDWSSFVLFIVENIKIDQYFPVCSLVLGTFLVVIIFITHY